MNKVKLRCPPEYPFYLTKSFRYTPIGLVFLVAGKFVTTKNLGDVWEGLALYMVTVLSGLAVHAVIVLPLIFFICTRRNPFKFGANMLKALFTAWGTASR